MTLKELEIKQNHLPGFDNEKALEIIKKHSLKPDADYTDSWILKAMEEYDKLNHRGDYWKINFASFIVDNFDMMSGDTINGYDLSKRLSELHEQGKIIILPSEMDIELEFLKKLSKRYYLIPR